VQEIIQFAMYHWLLSGLFILLLIGLFLEEARAKGLMRQINPQRAVHLINRENAVVIDIRDRNAFQEGHIVDSINIARADLEKDLQKIEKYKDRPIILVCAMGQTAGAMAAKLRKENFPNVHVLSGGINAWKTAQMPLVKK
jgi:rhodanese-related sulfurtransferase